MLCRIIEHFPNADNWNVNDVVDITNPEALIREGKVEVLKKKTGEKKVAKAEKTGLFNKIKEKLQK